MRAVYVAKPVASQTFFRRVCRDIGLKMPTTLGEFSIGVDTASGHMAALRWSRDISAKVKETIQ